MSSEDRTKLIQKLVFLVIKKFHKPVPQPNSLFAFELLSSWRLVPCNDLAAMWGWCRDAGIRTMNSNQ